MIFKGTVSQDFCFRFFLWIIFLQAPECNIGVILNCFKNSQRYLPVKVHHRYLRDRQHILLPVPLVLLILVANLPLVSTKPAANLPPVSIAPAANLQIMGTLSDCWHLTMNTKEKIYINVNFTNQRCPNKIIETFLIEDFFHLPPVSMTPVVHLEMWILYISPRISKKFKTALMVYSEGWGKLSHEKNLKSKI